MFKDYYHILGVSPEADAEAIKAAFRQLAYEYHPDRNGEDEAAHQKFILINEAYQALADPEARLRFHHRYLVHYGKTKKVPVHSSIELTRQKRASRYGRGHYAQRIRYRGTSYRADRSGQGGYRPRSDPAAEAARYVMWQERIEAEAQYYATYARWGRRLALTLLLVLGLILGDYYLPRQFREETVTAVTLLPAGQPARSLLMETPESRLPLSPRAAQFLEAGSVVSVERSALAAIPAHVHAFSRGYPRVFGVQGSFYGPGFPFVAWALLGLCLATLYFRRNPVYNAYLGTATAVALVAAVLGWLLG